ncbi:claudin-15 isoform X2 [Struthio camelus]|uniref:claudin-15 isoform X2 n=1 Tax=Struthio camelus TaxID=8801 RepID=UPI003603C53E
MAAESTNYSSIIEGSKAATAASATSRARWRISSTATVLVPTDWISEGLWMECPVTALGKVQCKKFSYLLSADTHIQACRALMIISILLGFIATVLSLLGLKCTHVGLSNEDRKVKFAATGGFIFILGGLCSMVAVSWYAAMVTAQFFDPLYAGTKYELGDALYLGWAGSILYMLGGIFLTCSCKGKKREKYSGSKYGYSVGQAAPQKHIYTKNSETVTSTKEYV